MRYRPVDDVVDEIRNSGLKFIELHSDNLTADRDYAVELFTKLIPLNIGVKGMTIEGGEYLCYKFLSSSNDDIKEAVGEVIKHVVKNRISVDQNEMILKELDGESFYHEVKVGKIYELQIKKK
jgi:DNA gyrase inhibitor GyrI